MTKKPIKPQNADPKRIIVLHSTLTVTVGVFDGDQVGEKLNIPVDFSPLNEKGFADALKLVNEKKKELTAQINKVD